MVMQPLHPLQPQLPLPLLLGVSNRAPVSKLLVRRAALLERRLRARSPLR
jgi:hypothetical protein